MFLVMKVSLYVKNSESDLQLVYNTVMYITGSKSPSIFYQKKAC